MSLHHLQRIGGSSWIHDDHCSSSPCTCVHTHTILHHRALLCCIFVYVHIYFVLYFTLYTSISFIPVFNIYIFFIFIFLHSYSCVFGLLVLLLLQQISPWGLIKYISIYLTRHRCIWANLLYPITFYSLSHRRNTTVWQLCIMLVFQEDNMNNNRAQLKECTSLIGMLLVTPMCPNNAIPILPTSGQCAPPGQVKTPTWLCVRSSTDSLLNNLLPVDSCSDQTDIVPAKAASTRHAFRRIHCSTSWSEDHQLTRRRRRTRLIGPPGSTWPRSHASQIVTKQ